MKRFFFLLALVLAISVSGFAQTPITVTDGTRTCTNCRKLVFTSITVNGTTATIAGGGGGGSGDVVGPGSATDNAVARFNSTTGKLIQNSVVLIGDTGNITGVGTLNTHTIPGGTGTFALTSNLPVGADPAGSIGLTAVNGVAGTFMRSDGAPALNQGISPTWTGPHTYSPSANITPLTISGYSLTGSSAVPMVSFAGTINTTGSPDIFKFAVTDTARGANTKLFNFYGGAAGTTSLFALNNNGTELAFNAAGPTIRNNGSAGLNIRGGSSIVSFNNAGMTLGNNPSADFTMVGGVRVNDANAYDLTLAAADAWNLSTNRNGGNLRLVPGAPNGSGTRGQVIFGLADSATPLPVTLSISSATGTNTAGVNWTFAGSRGTGTGAGGSLIWQTAPSGSSGASQNALVTAFTIASDGVIYPKSYNHANLPTPVNGDGGMVYCSDCTIASPCASGGTGALAKRLNGAWVCN